MAPGPARVHLTGDREGAYIVSEERADGSLVLTPEAGSGPGGRPGGRPPSRERRQPVSTGVLLSQLFTGRRAESFSTSREALAAWGVDLHEDESIAEFVIADVGGLHGFVALTSRRLIFLEGGGGTALEPRLERPLEQLRAVKPVGRRGRGGIAIEWEDGAPTVVESLDRAQLGRLHDGLAAHARE